MSLKHFLVVPFALLPFVACDDSNVTKKPTEIVDAAATVVPGVCKPSDCPQPAQGVACCTPNAACGYDPTGLLLGCLPNPGSGSTVECKVADCKKQNGTSGCCTPSGACGTDPFGNGIFCFPPPPPVDAKPLCALDKCPNPDGGTVKPCCQINGQCGVDALGIGLCFPPPVPLCDLAACPQAEGGPAKCCQLNGKCGVDTLGIGICFAPPPKPVSCDLASCPKPGNGIKACCQPDGSCGWDSLNIGICFPPPPPPVDAGPPVKPPPISTTPPDDPSITKDCPSFIGLFGPQWGCCSAYGVCGTFLGGQCSLSLGSQIPNGPPPPKDSGIKEPFMRCTPPPAKADSGTP